MDRKSPVTREQAEAEELAAIGQEILINARNELYLNMRYMDVALSALFPVPDYAVRGLQTDGISLFFHPRDLAALYRRGRAEVNRAYLHMIFHCLFGHFSGARDPRWGNELIWDVACDVAAELLTDGLPYRCVHRHPSPLKREFTARLAEEVSVVTAQSVYRYLEKRQFAVQYLLRLRQEFFVDDHSLWRDSPNSDKNQRQGKNNDWDDIREHMETEMETLSKEAGGGSEGLLEQVKIGNRERYDYRDFLQKFTRLKETLKVDTDSFDYIYYDYGMRTYGNMPLIEPLETKELRRIEEFVIVIDTSMSCSGELVKRFLEETCSVLNQRESFFERANIHIIQCDDRVQRDTPIRSREDGLVHGASGDRGEGRHRFPSRVPVRGRAHRLGRAHGPSGASIFHRRLRAVSGENAVLRHRVHLYEGRLPGCGRARVGNQDYIGPRRPGACGGNKMNIKRAKEEIKNSIEAYLAKDARGEYLIPAVRQRPLLLMGPPGIGKTQIMEQVARECRVGLVSYTITHHTRQSAIGLPFITEKEFGGKMYSRDGVHHERDRGLGLREDRDRPGFPRGFCSSMRSTARRRRWRPRCCKFLQAKTFGSHEDPRRLDHRGRRQSAGVQIPCA